MPPQPRAKTGILNPNGDDAETVRNRVKALGAGDYANDIGRSGRKGLIQGGTETAGILGDLRKGVGNAAGERGELAVQVMEALGESGLAEYSPFLRWFAAPSTKDIQAALSKRSPLIEKSLAYQPKTIAGHFAEFGGEIFPGLLTGGAGAARTGATQVGKAGLKGLIRANAADMVRNGVTGYAQGVAQDTTGHENRAGLESAAGNIIFGRMAPKAIDYLGKAKNAIVPAARPRPAAILPQPAAAPSRAPARSPSRATDDDIGELGKQFLFYSDVAERSAGKPGVQFYDAQRDYLREELMKTPEGRARLSAADGVTAPAAVLPAAPSRPAAAPAAIVAPAVSVRDWKRSVAEGVAAETMKEAADIFMRPGSTPYAPAASYALSPRDMVLQAQKEAIARSGAAKRAGGGSSYPQGNPVLRPR